MNKCKVALVCFIAAFATGGAYASPVVVPELSGFSADSGKVGAQDEFTLSGRWSGVVGLNGVGLEIIFNIEEADGRLSATMDVPQQGAKGIPADKVSFENGELRIYVGQIAFEYAGYLNDDGEFKGNMFQNGYNLILDLSRNEEGPVQHVQSEGQSGSYVTWDVIYQNRKDRNTLGATIVLPEDYDESTPIAVLVSGSGQQDRDGEVFGHKTMKVMADYLASRGIGSLRYDDRGTGQSDTVGLLKATSLSFMEDALAGVEFLKTEKGFRNIGIVGHSEGGMIAYMIGARSEDVRFLVSLAGPAMRGDSILVYQNEALMESQKMPRKTIRAYRDMLRDIFEIKSTNDPDHVRARLDEYVLDLENRYGDEIGPLKDNIRPLLTPSPWMDFYLTYSPAEDLKLLNCPLFALNGSKDMQVPSRENIRALRIYTYRNRDMKIKEYKGHNHLFQHCRTGLPLEYYQIEETISEEVLHDIASWILNLRSR